MTRALIVLLVAFAGYALSEVLFDLSQRGRP